jgi:hypothetical protein
MEYYRLTDDLGIKRRWYLGDLNVDIEDVWNLRKGRNVNLLIYKDLKIEIDQKGTPLDYTCSNADNIPVISDLFVECLYEFMHEIDLIPVAVQNLSTNLSNRFYVMVVKNLIDCVDESRSDFRKFEIDDDVRPDLAGEYRSINILKVDKSKISKNIFRLAKYDLVTIVSEKLKKNLEEAKLYGLKFKLVS